MGKLLQQMVKFSAVGMTAFCIDYALMIVLTEAAGLDYLISATTSFIVSTVFNYAASMHFVFTHRSDIGRVREFVLFCGLSAVGLALNNLLLWCSVDVAGFDYRVAKIFVGLIVSTWNFASRRLFLDGGRPEKRRRLGSGRLLSR